MRRRLARPERMPNPLAVPVDRTAGKCESVHTRTGRDEGIGSPRIIIRCEGLVKREAPPRARAR